MTRLRVLARTFACCPPRKAGFISGKDILGWNLVKQIARFHDLTVLTAPWNQANILSEWRTNQSQPSKCTQSGYLDFWTGCSAFKAGITSTTTFGKSARISQPGNCNTG
jgi:hypothetical protein